MTSPAAASSQWRTFLLCSAILTYSAIAYLRIPPSSGQSPVLNLPYFFPDKPLPIFPELPHSHCHLAAPVSRLTPFFHSARFQAQGTCCTSLSLFFLPIYLKQKSIRIPKPTIKNVCIWPSPLTLFVTTIMPSYHHPLYLQGISSAHTNILGGQDRYYNLIGTVAVPSCAQLITFLLTWYKLGSSGEREL